MQIPSLSSLCKQQQIRCKNKTKLYRIVSWEEFCKMSCNICTRYKILLRIIILFNFMAFRKMNIVVPIMIFCKKVVASTIHHPPGVILLCRFFSILLCFQQPRMILNFYVYYIKDNGVIFRCV